MIIHKPVIREENREISISAKIEIRNTDKACPPELWFKFPSRYKEYVTDRADGFAVALLPLAMYLGEDLEIRGEVSSRLAFGMREYLRIQSQWKPDFFKMIEIQYDRLAASDASAPLSGVGCAFSGGIDSYHTLWSHLPQNESFSKYRITHALMINGFEIDMDLDNNEDFQNKQNIYEPIMKKNGLEFLVSRTNHMLFAGFEVHKQSFAAFITASALVLGRLFFRFYIPSSYKFTSLELHPDGSHLMLDHLLGTETMQTVHDNPHLTRVEKAAALVQWPDTYHSLRVCFQGTAVNKETNTIVNCCRCEKCVRTMTTLQILGVLPKYTSFPKPFKRRDIRNYKLVHKGRPIFTHEMIDYAVQTGRRDIAFDLRCARLKSRILWRPLHDLAVLSFRLERRFKCYAWLIGFVKAFLKKYQWGRGWLY